MVMGHLMMVVVVGCCWFLEWRMGLEWSQARWFEFPLLDEGDFLPSSQFPHKRERWTQRIGIGSLVGLGGHGFQSLVLHREDHECL